MIPTRGRPRRSRTGPLARSMTRCTVSGPGTSRKSSRSSAFRRQAIRIVFTPARSIRQTPLRSSTVRCTPASSARSNTSASSAHVMATSPPVSWIRNISAERHVRTPFVAASPRGQPQPTPRKERSSGRTGLMNRPRSLCRRCRLDPAPDAGGPHGVPDRRSRSLSRRRRACAKQRAVVSASRSSALIPARLSAPIDASRSVRAPADVAEGGEKREPPPGVAASRSGR
jgi:hypothetical protein